ncbi:flagellar hook-associated protein FlgK [Paenisporosarcina quisquiliarum]|uniref:flagellar hook-associated protein FlgK n=1 Tax=Paenisporosarcina quisquiliarum TaxID=365346 RepID=UPI0037356CEA
MRSTFMGLEASKRGLFTQQTALYTTGHNIANANTAGYSRQRVNMQPTLGFPGTGLNAPMTPGFIGTGVEAGSVQRIRDTFTDSQFRQESNKLGYWESRSSAISQMEDVLNEPSDYGLAKSMDEFWKSLQDLSVNPENGGARAVVVQRGIAVADSFNYMHKSISEIKDNAAKEIGISLNNVNSILEQIGDLNRQITAIEPNGYMPNDLYDARDNLLDELGQFFPIETSNTPSGGNALKVAEGSVTVSIKLKDGTSLKVVDGNDFAQLRTSSVNKPIGDVTPDGAVKGFYLVQLDSNGNETLLDKNMNPTVGIDDDSDPLTPDVEVAEVHDILNFYDLGKIKSLTNSYGYVSGTDTDPLTSVTSNIVKGLFPDMITKLNTMAKAFAEEFNRIHIGDGTTEYPKGSDINGRPGQAFFVDDNETDSNIDASNIYVSNEIIKDPGKIVASDSAPTVSPDDAEPGNGNFALKLANMKFENLSDLGEVSVQTYFQSVIGQLGVDGQQASRLMFNTATLQQAVAERRASVSSVSLDEEMTNMITFQQAYNASARMITVVDETLDKIINGMGRVGN